MVLWGFDTIMLRHKQPWESYHIEVPERLQAIWDRITEVDLDDKLLNVPCRRAQDEEIRVVHTQRYIDDIRSTEEMTDEECEEFCKKYEDIFVNPFTFEAAVAAAGAAIDMVKFCIKTREHGFAAIRPPGHHASPDAGCGFCIFNNIAIAAKHALLNGAQRVLIVDWDVHAGQGTQECIADDENIRLVSIHRYENGHFWPNLEQSAVRSNFRNTVNVPLNSVGMGDSEYFAIMQLVVLPMITDFKPDIILVSCGFDAALGDPEGEMRITPAGYATMTKMLMNTGRPIMLLLEGGYFIEAVATCAEAVIDALFEKQTPIVETGELHPSLPPVIRRIHDHYGNDYPTFRALRRLENILKTEDTDHIREFQGERTVGIPYQTRGIYSPRPEDVVDSFRDELDELVNNYTDKRYMDIFVVEKAADNSEDLIMSADPEGKSATILGPRDMMFLLLITVALPMNPLAKIALPEPKAEPTDNMIRHLAEFLENAKNNPQTKFLPLFSFF